MSEPKRISAGCRTTDMFETVDNCRLCSYPDRCAHWCHQSQEDPEPGEGARGVSGAS